MNTSFTDFDTLLNTIKTNYFDDCDMMILSLTGCIETDSYDTSDWTKKLTESSTEVEALIPDLQSKKDQMKTIYDNVFGNKG